MAATRLRFNGIMQLTDSANLLLGGANITTAVGDVFRSVAPQRASGGMVGNNRLPSATTITSVTLTGTSTYLSNEIGWRNVPR